MNQLDHHLEGHLQMKNWRLGITVIFLALLHSFPARAETIEKISISGSELRYPIPEGFCNVTSDVQGIIMKEALDKQRNALVPEAQIIIANCDKDTVTPGYTWGWIGAVKNVAFTQETVNKITAQVLQNEALLKKLTEQIQETSKEAIEELFGLETTIETNKQKIIWADDNSILLATRIISQINDVELRELALQSTTVIDDLYIHTYIYNLENETPTMQELSKILIENAANLKQLN